MLNVSLKAIKSSGNHFGIVSVESVENRLKEDEMKLIPGYPIYDWTDYCMFCAKRYWVFNDSLEQVICAPCNTERTFFKETSLAWRCQPCRLKNKINAFDDRKIIDPKRLTIASSSVERPMLWRFEREIKIKGR